jgi:glycosyltransferase involved in cell wall biosynthesis
VSAKLHGVRSAHNPAGADSTRICVVGPGTRFLSGISYYTFCLCNALTEHGQVSALLMRRLLPRRLYPGKTRVGARLSDLRLSPSIRSFDGVDWFWLPTLFGAFWFLARRRPHCVIFQWWTGTVLHTYLALAILARLFRAKIVVEFHETQDVGEEARPWARRYVETLAPWLFRRASRFVVHSTYDRTLVRDRYGIDPSAIDVIPHATYAHYRRGARRSPRPECNLLYFGVIRPFKGVEDLVRAFDEMPPEVAADYRLTVVGETWEGWTLPAALIAASRYRDRIDFVNRYVTDEEADAAFANADIVVLPYRRSSQSGPLHIAMHYGLPVVVTAVGGLIEAVEGYAGAVLVAPDNPGAISDGIRRARALVGQRFEDPRSWAVTGARYSTVLATVLANDRGKRAGRMGGRAGIGET